MNWLGSAATGRAVPRCLSSLQPAGRSAPTTKWCARCGHLATSSACATHSSPGTGIPPRGSSGGHVATPTPSVAGQPRGPYHILAYSSAGAFGYEIAQQLRADGDDVALLALVDPLGMDQLNPRRFGHWALSALFMRGRVRQLVRWGGLLRAVVPRALRAKRSAANANDWTLSALEFEAHVSRATSDRDHILRFTALLELNTGRPFGIQGPELDAVAPSAYLDVLLARVVRVDASIDPEMIRRALIQYELQVRSQHRYRLQRYDGAVYMFDAAGPFSGLPAVHVRPFVRRLFARSLPFDGLSDRVRDLLAPFPEGLRAHYGCMRNDAFAQRLAAELDAALRAVDVSDS